jgi:hypothetical protein
MYKNIVTSLMLFILVIKVSGQINSIPFYDINFECSLKGDSTKMIITNRQDLIRFTGCNNGFDFANYILVCIDGTIGGCGIPEVEYQITKDLRNKVILINAFVYQFGVCRRNNRYKRFIKISKPENDYRIEFKVKKIINDE